MYKPTIFVYLLSMMWFYLLKKYLLALIINLKLLAD